MLGRYAVAARHAVLAARAHVARSAGRLEQADQLQRDAIATPVTSMAREQKAALRRGLPLNLKYYLKGTPPPARRRDIGSSESNEEQEQHWRVLENKTFFICGRGFTPFLAFQRALARQHANGHDEARFTVR